MGKKILIAAGGTGGHLFPAQSLAKRLKTLYEIEIFFTGGELSKNKYFESHFFSYEEISSAPLNLNLKLFKNIKVILKGILKSLKIIRAYKPDLIIAFGSFHTFPTLVAALLMRKKIYLHEQNKIMGKVNRLFAKFARKLFITFPNTFPEYPKKSFLVQMPLKFDKAQIQTQLEVRKKLNLNLNLKTLLVCGGSQGAKSINHFFLKSLEHIKSFSFQVIHITGELEDIEAIKKVYKKNQIQAYVKAFDFNMHDLMQASDFMIGRAGASIVSEIIELELPSILIPYPYAKGHQKYNADFMEQKVKGGIKLLEEEFSETLFAKFIVSFFNDANIKKYRQYIKAYKKEAYRLDFAKIISEDLCLEEKK